MSDFKRDCKSDQCFHSEDMQLIKNEGCSRGHWQQRKEGCARAWTSEIFSKYFVWVRTWRKGIQGFRKEQLKYASALYKTFRGAFLQLVVICGERRASRILEQNASETGFQSSVCQMLLCMGLYGAHIKQHILHWQIRVRIQVLRGRCWC